MKLHTTFTALLMLGQLLFSPGVQALESAPDFSLAGIDAEVTLAQHKGQVIYLDFWASWCTPCRHSFPWMNQLKKQYAAQGLAIIAINLDKAREDSRAFLTATTPQFTIAFDPNGKVAETYQVMGMPSSYLIDRNGQLQHSHIGFRDKDRPALEQQIKELLQQ